MLTKKEIDSLIKSGNWLIRFDNEGICHGGFKWLPMNQWTIAPDWNDRPECGGGLHGQSPAGAGYCQSGTRMILAETQGKRVVIDKNKVKVQKAKIIAINEDIPVEILNKLAKHGGSLDLKLYNHPLPANIKARNIIR